MQGQLAAHLRLTLAAFALLALSGCYMANPFARDPMGDIEKFKWNEPQHMLMEARRQGRLSADDGFDALNDVIEPTLEQLILEWFPIGTPIAEIEAYFEGQGFEVWRLQSIDPDNKKYHYEFLEQGETFFSAGFEDRFGFLGLSGVEYGLAFIYDASDITSKTKRITITVRPGVTL